MLKDKGFPRFFALAALCCALLFIPPHFSVALKQGPLAFVLSPLAVLYHAYYFFVQTGSLTAFYGEYRQHQQELSRLKNQTTLIDELRQENERLRRIVGISPDNSRNFTVARVIGLDPTNWLNSILIDKGTNDGLGLNQPVVTVEGVVGKIIEVGPRFAKVLLISDVNARVVALVQRTRQEGLLEGIGRGLCRLKYLRVDAEVELSDTVVTAGSGGVYPKGLLIGTVESVRIERGGLYKSCVVRPATAHSALEEVLCLDTDSGNAGS